MNPSAKDLEFIKTDDLLMVKTAIDFYSKQKDNDKRLYYGEMYNKFGSLQFQAREVDVSTAAGAARLEYIKGQYLTLKKRFKMSLGYDYSIIVDIKNAHFVSFGS